MTNEQVIIYLNTPLVSHQPKGGTTFLSTQIRGKILEESAGGVLIQVKGIGNEKGWNDNNPFKKIFLPHHKINFIAVD